jgi:hypothetical protein
MKIYLIEGEYQLGNFGDPALGNPAPLTDAQVNAVARSGKLKEAGIDIGTYAHAEGGEAARMIAPVPYALMTAEEKADADSQVVRLGPDKGMTLSEVKKRNAKKQADTIAARDAVIAKRVEAAKRLP